MLELVKFKLLLKKYKNVFSDILNNMSIESINGNVINFVDEKGNKIFAEMNDNDIIFKKNDKEYIKVIIPKKDENGDIKVIDIIKEERPNGCIIEVIDKYYGFTRDSSDEKVLVDLISKRYVFDRNIKIDDNINFDETYKLKTVFESHLKTFTKPMNSTRWYTDSPYSTITLINGVDISYIYDIVNGIDKIYRIYDLYNGIINERNSDDIFAIHLGLLRKDGLGYKEINGITSKEDAICGNDINNTISNQEATFIYDLINKRLGYRKTFDIHDINSIISAITYQKTAVECAKESIERELGIPYEEFDKLDCNEQHKLLYSRKINTKKRNKKDVLVMIGSGEHSTFIKVKKGERVEINDGTIIEAGLTPDESRQRLDDQMDDIFYSKPVALIKKISRRIKNKFSI